MNNGDAEKTPFLIGNHPSPYGRCISELQGFIEDAQSLLDSSIDKLAYCPRAELKARHVCITEITEARNRLRHLKSSLFALREAEVYA